MEQWPIKPVHNRNLSTAGAPGISLASAQGAAEVTATAVSSDSFVTLLDAVVLSTSLPVLDILCPLSLQLFLVFDSLRCSRGTILAADLRDGEDGFPAGKDLVAAVGSGVAEAGGGKGALGPAVVDAGEVPVYIFGGGVAVELVADVDEVLDGCNVDVVDGAEVKDYGFKGWFVGLDHRGFAAAWAGVIPGAVLGRLLA